MDRSELHSPQIHNIYQHSSKNKTVRMVDGIFSSQIGEDELSTLAQSQIKEGSEDSQQIIKTLAVINYLKITVLVIIGFILGKLDYFNWLI